MDDTPTLASDATLPSAPRSAARVLGTGDRAGRYAIGPEIGRGAMGIVYEAEDPTLDRRVALKVLQGYAGERQRNELLREARASAQLSSPHVVAVYDVALTDDDSAYVVSELVEGQTLRQWLRSDKRSRGEIIAAFEDAAKGLVAIHEAGLVHRDFKPDNVIVGDDGRVRIADFGLARGGTSLTRALSGDDVAVVSSEFESAEDESGGVIRGTPAYMAPELFARAPASALGDQFAFCVALYEALLGRRPFEGRTPHEIAASQLDSGPTTPDDLPSTLATILHKGLAIRSGDRFESMAELLAALRRARTSRRRWGLLAIAGVGLAVPGVWLLAAAPGEDMRCDDAGPNAVAVWTDARERIGDALRAGPRGDAPESATRVLARIDAWADSLGAGFHEACLAAPSSDAAAHERRLACLDDARLRGEGLIKALDGLGPNALESATHAVHSLPRAERCAVDQGGSQAVANPSALAVRVRAYEVRIRAQLGESGLLNDAAALAEEAAASGDAMTHVEGLRVLAAVAVASSSGRDIARADAALLEASDVAVAAGLDGELARIALERSQLAGTYGTDYEGAQRLAERAIDLAGVEEPELAARAQVQLAEFLRHAGRLDEARDASEAGVAELERRATDDLAVCEAHAQMATILFAVDEREAAAEIAMVAAEQAEDILGDSHPKTLRLLNNAVAMRSGAGDHEGAHELAEKLHERRLAGLGSTESDLVASWQNLAAIRREVGATEGAIEAARSAVEVAVAGGGDEGLDAAEARTALAYILLTAGRTDDAVEPARRAYDDLVRHLGRDNPSTFMAGLLRLDTLQKSGHQDAARELLDALGDDATARPVGINAGNILMARAEARLHEGDVAGALADLEVATECLREAAPEVWAEHARWLETHGIVLELDTP